LLLSLQLFYLVTEHYPQGSIKELRRWAYEIYSTFLVPTAVSIPLHCWCSASDNCVCTEWSDVLDLIILLFWLKQLTSVVACHCHSHILVHVQLSICIPRDEYYHTSLPKQESEKLFVWALVLHKKLCRQVLLALK